MPLKTAVMFCVLMFTLLFLSACGGSGAAPVVGNKWTVMVYMDADNNLDIGAPYDVKEMLDVGSTANVTVLIQYDTRSTPTRRYRVDKGKLTLLEDLGEQNMASSDTLRDFIVSGVQTYPADHYALILWDHGNGWQSGVDKRVASLLEDWGNTNIKSAALPNYVVAKGISEAAAQTGLVLDILGVDACIMATMEAAYEFRNSAAIMVASQDLVQGLGWDYRDLLSRLTQNPTISPVELAKAMVASYRQFAESSAYGFGDQTITALTLGNGIVTLVQEVDALAKRLTMAMDDPETRIAAQQRITAARSQVQQLHAPTYVDLFDFSALLEPGGSPAAIQQALLAITIAEYHGSIRPKAHGMNIVFYDLPVAVNNAMYGFDYINFDPLTGKGSHSSFINDFGWDEMMAEYFGYQYPDLVK